MDVVGLYNYWIVVVLMMIGFYAVIARPNLVKKIAGLFVFQTSVFILYISMAKVSGGTAPILEEGVKVYSNPLPHVLILTAIVVGVATTALGSRWSCASTRHTGPSTRTRYAPRTRSHETRSVIAANHLPALQVVIPLISAPICALLTRDRVAWAFALVVSWTVLLVAVLLLNRVMDEGPLSYAIGGWAAPWGIEYRVDAASAFVLLIVAIIGSVVMPFAYASVRHEIPRRRIHLFYTCYLLCLTGLLGIAITGDAFNLFVFLEISSLSSYVLISLGREPPRAHGRLPVPGHGHHRGNLHPHRGGAAVHDDRHAQHGGPR